MTPPPAIPVPYRAGDDVDVMVDGSWRRAEVLSLIATTALSDRLRFRVLYRWRDGDGATPPEHCGPDGLGRRMRPVHGGTAVVAFSASDTRDGARVALSA